MLVQAVVLRVSVKGNGRTALLKANNRLSLGHLAGVVLDEKGILQDVRVRSGLSRKS